ncbi:MAG: autotransporter outer membrane beta-barrel domain-containing protein, partial [Gammaproteobacteria bacterium]|nr:autotransporter outer membrane beta-barrel domain-containing protein [Gammaproteobacteria bacterium]
GYSLLDEVTITNSGALSAQTGGAGSALGIYASAATTATVDNSGDITVDSLGGGLVEGIFAYGLDASVTNSGDITATSNTGGMFGGGIQVYGVDSAAIDNSGDIDVSVNGIGGEAIGLYAVVNTLAGTVDVTNSGAIDVAADNAFGVDTLNGLVGAVGTVNVTNSGAITATGYYYSYGVRALGYGDVTVTNTATGSIDSTAYYQGLGILANSADGDAIVTNAGTIDATSTYLGIGAYYAIGIDAFAAAGNATVSNSGAITATSANNYAKAIWAQAAGDVAVTNSGTVLATGYYSHGVDAYSVMGNVTVGNSGGITAHSDAGRAYGIAAYAGVGDVAVTNAASGDILAESGGKYAFGIFASAPTGTTTVTNAGDITATSFPASTAPLYGDKAYGIVALGDTVVVDNSGTITADGGAKYGNGIFASSTGVGGTTVTSSGDITASSYFVSYGIDARSAGGDTTVSNGGNIAVSAYNYAYGVNAYSAVGDVVVNNSGDITATMDVLGTFAAAVKMEAPLGTSTLNNAAGGTIQAFGPDGQAWAVYGSNVINTINNSGTITGAINLFDGDDAFYNNATGVWDASGTYTSDFGLGNDYLRNAGDVIVSQAAIGFGDGDDTFLTVAGGEVHLNTGTIAMGAGINAFVNGGTVFVNNALNYIDAGVNGTVTNNGTIDMVDNHVNDALTVGPVLGGVGSLNIDVNQVALTADSLYVIGDMTANAVQTVNVNFPMFPITQHMTIPFAWITGNSVASNFAPGTLLNYNYPLNFIDVDLTISSAIDATNTVDDVFSINLDVNGLNDTGSIAALTAQGAANFMNAQVGTFRQRLGVNPYGDAGKVMSAYVRYYTETGDVNPGHNAHNFGQGGNFDYRQASWGTEVGVNANLWSNLHAGVVLGNADSRQRLDSPGVGTNRMDGMTFGMYLTWYVPNGWYVDLTARKMAADVYSTSVGGVLQSRVHTNAVSLEGGYEFKVGNINIVPQIQYTWTQVDEIDPYHGQYADLVLGGGHYNRGRVGVDFNTQIESGDFRWTPYGSLNWVHNSRGASEYTIGGVFHGDTWVNGSAFMAEFGVGVERGGFGFTIGGNWTDGGSYDSVLGGQASFRYSW